MSLEPALCPEASENAYGVVNYNLVLTFGSSSISTYFGGCSVTVARNSAGNYTGTLPKPYRTLLGFYHGFQDASGAILFAVIRSETIGTDGKFIFEVVTETGTATDPTAGDKLFLNLKVANDILNDKFRV